MVMAKMLAAQHATLGRELPPQHALDTRNPRPTSSSSPAAQSPTTICTSASAIPHPRQQRLRVATCHTTGQDYPRRAC